ncbi:hypothetical protein [Halorarius halobius]|uniref:hypothetical protein n=1 Tax=Halorarius halobius TaxID=2962671 RepID=UPI0020CD0E17|nr:hypothetical protein [Halorarius halobius]
MTHKQLTRIATTIMTLVVVLSMVTAPVAAADGDDGEDDDGLLTNTTESVTDTVDSTTDLVSNTSDSVTDTVDSTAETVDSTTDPATDPVTEAPGADTVTDGVSDTVTKTTDTVEGTTDRLPGTERLGDVSNPDEIAFSELPSADNLVDPESNPVPSPGEGSASLSTLEQTAKTGQLPVGIEDLPFESTPVTGDNAPIEPEDSPYGSDGVGNFDACALPVNDEDLPLDSVPGPGDLPVSPPGVPTDLLTPSAVAGLAFGTAPKPCTVYDPHDPFVDPTEIPEDPSASLGSDTLDAGADGFVYGGNSRGELYNASQYGAWTVGASPDSVGTFQQFGIDNGANERSKYVYVYNFRSTNFSDRSTEGQTSVAVLSKEVGLALSCQSDLANASVNFEQPSKGGPCSYELIGLPSLPVGPQTVFDALEEPPEPPELPGIGGLPLNSDSLANL